MKKYHASLIEEGMADQLSGARLVTGLSNGLSGYPSFMDQMGMSGRQQGSFIPFALCQTIMASKAQEEFLRWSLTPGSLKKYEDSKGRDTIDGLLKGD